MARKEGKFKLKNITKFAALRVGHTIPESDLCFQDNDAIYQYEYQDSKQESKIDVKPGIFSLTREM